MGLMQWVIEIGLIGLLIVTLVHLLRLGRALAMLKRDRGPLEELVTGFAASTREAQAGIDHLRQAADGTGRRLAQQIEAANVLRDDLAYMIDRAERLADRLDLLVRNSRSFDTLQRAAPAVQSGFVPVAGGHETTDHHEQHSSAPKVRSQAERDLLQALRLNK